MVGDLIMAGLGLYLSITGTSAVDAFIGFLLTVYALLNAAELYLEQKGVE